MIFYKRNDPERAWIYKTFVIIITIGALSAIDMKASGLISSSLFSPERQVRKWLDEVVEYKSQPADPLPAGQMFHYDLTTTTGQSLSIYQPEKDADTLVIVSRAHLEDCFKIIPEKERDRRWLEIGLALLRYDMKISPDARFGPVVVSNWIPFGPATTKQQFIAELRRFHHALEAMNILCIEASLMRDAKTQ